MTGTRGNGSPGDRTGPRDGRYIDPALGTLSGEGAQQRVDEREKRLEQIARDAWTHAPSSTEPVPAGGPTYYDRPVIKETVWKWYVPAYLYAGGAAGAAAALGAAAQALGGESARGLVWRCRDIAAAGTAAGTVFLIADLGRPSRFLNMLRVFRPTSPMNVGSWILTPATGLSAAAVLARARSGLAPAGDVAGFAAGVLGVPLAGYTAVLVSNSAVPVWQAVRRSLPSLFVSSAISSAAALLELATLTEAEERTVRRYGRLGAAGELVAAFAVERDAGAVERVGRPLHEGLSGALWKTAKACAAASLALSLVPGRNRAVRTAAAAIGTAGSLAVRFAIFRAGIPSARDPRATFEQQRAGFGAAEVTGRTAVT